MDTVHTNFRKINLKTSHKHSNTIALTLTSRL